MPRSRELVATAIAAVMHAAVLASSLWAGRRPHELARLRTGATIEVDLLDAPPTAHPGAIPDADAPRTPPNPNALLFTNSDLAFSGNHVVVGNYHGFNTYNIERANKPQLLASVVCPGGQGDVSTWGNLLFMSVEQTRGRVDCGLQGVVPPVSNERFRGVRIFDISDMKNPKQVAAVQTCRGSHTHTLVPDPQTETPTRHLWRNQPPPGETPNQL